MRILITGGSGFIGCHLLASLASYDHELFSLSRQRSQRNLLSIEKQVRQVFCDLRDPAAIRQVLKQVQPESVIHLASVSPVAYSHDHPNEVIEVNLMGTVNLAEGCRTEVPGLRQFLFASTSETYGFGPLPKKEDTLQNPGSPYSVSKFAAERYLLYLRDAFEFPVTILRPFNTYGRKDTASFVVERIISQMLRQGAIRLGDPSVVRDWLHIDDHVEAYRVCLGNERSIGQVMNFCTGRGVSIAELVDLLSSMTGFHGAIEWHTLPKRPLDVPVNVGDAEKAYSLLGWRPLVSLEQGLQIVVDYWRKKGEV
jgi:nucleoside-diphosphate-sugar epimerase